MIILRQKNYSINKKTAAEIAGKLTKLGIIGAGLGTGVGIGVSAIKKHKKRHEDLEERLEKLELNRLGRKTDEDIREAVKGTKAEKKVEKILDKSTKEMKEASEKSYSKQDREVVPADIVKKVKEGDGVIQKDHNGDWRIVSMKTNPPTFWDAHYDSKSSAKKALGGYFANK